MINRFEKYWLVEPHWDIIYGYSDKVIKEVDDIIEKSWWDVLKLDNSPYKRKLIEWFTIDWSYSKDLDDAIWWVERTKKWGYIFEVSISDVAEIIQPFSALDLQALEKAESTYLIDKTIHMFPDKLSTNFISLNHNEKRLTQTYRIELDDKCNPVNFEMFDSILYNKKRYDYESFDDDFNNPDCENYDELHLFYEIANKLKIKDKKISWNLSVYNNDRFNFWWWIPQWIIEEIMIITNTVVNIYAFKNWIKVFNRVHMPEYKYKQFLGWTMWMAYYSIESDFHLWLQKDNYMHITSPIRRYSDLFSSYLLKGHSRWENIMYFDNEILDVINRVNKRIYLVKWKIFSENKKIETRKFIHIKNKAIHWDASKEELKVLDINNFNKLLYYFLWQENFDLPNLIFDELKNRINKLKVNDELLFLLFLTWNNKISDFILSFLSDKYENPYTLILKYLNSNSPIIKNNQTIRFFEKSYKVLDWKKIQIFNDDDSKNNVKYNRIWLLKYNWVPMRKIKWSYNSNAEWKRYIRKEICDYLLEKNINFAKKIVVMKNYDLQDIIDWKYSLSSLNSISKKNLEEVIIYFTINNIEFNDDITNLILSRIKSDLLLTDISISTLLFSQNEKFSRLLVHQINERKTTRNIIKFLRMNKNIDIQETIIWENNFYSIKIYYKWKIKIDLNSTDYDESDFFTDYSDLINYLRIILIDLLFETDINFFDWARF